MYRGQESRMDKRRQHVLHEFVQTEQNYLRDLHILSSTFFTPLKVRLSPGDLAKIFCNLEMLIMFHEQFVESLREQEAMEPERQTIGACLLKYVTIVLLALTLLRPAHLLYLVHPSQTTRPHNCNLLGRLYEAILFLLFQHEHGQCYLEANL
jgi:hypothetical protein